MQKKGTSYSTKRAWLDNDDKKVCKDYLKIFALLLIRENVGKTATFSLFSVYSCSNREKKSLN